MDYCSAGFCRDLLIVGGSRRRLDISGAESLAAIALQNGHPKERIAVGKTSYDSVTNLEKCASWPRNEAGPGSCW